jgi:hypothetical protein
MATNSRCFYAIESVNIASYVKGANPTGSQIYAPRGVQSASIDTTFNLDQVFELGQLSLYDQPELQPDVSVSVTKVLDGTMPIYFMATDTTKNSLNDCNSNRQSLLWMNIYPDTQSAASGTQLQSVMCSGVYLADISYTFPVDGNFTEELTFVGNDKFWYGKNIANGNEPGTYSFTVPAGDFDNTDDATVIGSGVQRRENLKTEQCTFPTIIPGMTAVNAATTHTAAQAAFDEHVQSISVSCSLGREDIFQLGQKLAFYKYMTFPIEVTTTFECITSEADQISADSAYDNLTNETIKIITDDGFCIDLSNKNKLTSVALGGGDTGGGNSSTTYTFRNFNDLLIYPVDADGVRQTVAAHSYNTIVQNGTVA